jgi:hypothetical protein
MLIIHPNLTSEYAKCKTIHIITRVNTEIQDICKECKCSHFTLIDNDTVPITKNDCMPFVDISRFLIE